MTWPSFSALSGAWLFLLFLPVILFYFLKLRRPRVEISSLILWQSVMEDQRVNSPFQKFKRNILLLLQLLLLLFLVLSAMQPYMTAGDDSSDYLPIMIDHSASMGAKDKPGGQTRLEVAKDHVRDLIDQYGGSKKISLIGFSSLSRRLIDFTDNKRLLKEALDKLEVDDMPGQAEGALELVKGLARTYSFERAVLFSDGNFPVRVDFELPFKLDYKKVFPATENIGITDLVAKRAGLGQWDVLIRLETSAEANSSGTLRLFQNGTEIATEDVIMSGGEVKRMVYRLDSNEATQLEVRLEVKGFDAMSADNVAYIDLPKARALSVIVGNDLNTFKFALGKMDHPMQMVDSGAAVESVDLMVTNKEENKQSASVTLHEGVIPKDLENLISVNEGGDQVIDWRKDNPLLQHVMLDDLIILEQVKRGEGVTEQDFEALGYDIIAEGQLGPLILSKRDGLQLHYYLLFDTDKSDLPYRVGFPIMVYNLVQSAMQFSDLAEVKGYRTGTLPAFGMKADAECEVKMPNGIVRKLKADSSGVLRAVPAIHSGRYEVNDGEIKVTVSVSLLSPLETSLKSVDQIQFKELTVESGSELKAERHMWYWLAVCAFIFLMVEWWYFNRRVGGGRKV